MAIKNKSLSADMKKANELRAMLAQLETGIKAEQDKTDKANKAKVEGLPAAFGLENGDYAAVIATIRRVTGTHGKRVQITDEIKKKVVELAKAGQTGAEIAAAVGCSVPTVANIKKAAGLVKARAK